MRFKNFIGKKLGKFSGEGGALSKIVKSGRGANKREYSKYFFIYMYMYMYMYSSIMYIGHVPLW